MVKLTINGQQHDVEAPANMPLLWVLRDVIGLRGTKFGCGMGLCGACTVHIDGAAVRSCITTVEGVNQSSKITTIEGLSSHGLHPLQQAWLAHQVPQCGYCQPGQIMSAAALLSQNRDPSDSDINDAMAGNACRCGTYPRIRAAIKAAAQAIREGAIR